MTQQSLIQSSKTGRSDNVEEMEFIIFNLGAEEYAIAIEKVHEIKTYESVTHLVNVPEYIKGITSIRGDIVPVIDMRTLFHMEQQTYTQATVMIILDIHESLVGIVVDMVTDVLPLKLAQIKSAKGFKLVVASDYINGIGLVEDRMLVIIDIDKLISHEDLRLLAASF